jgi:pilus assembly protein Flp/PilA
MHFLAYLAYHLDSLLSLPRRRRDDGASAVEYGLLVALIAAIIVLAVSTLGTKILSAFNKTGSALPD